MEKRQLNESGRACAAIMLLVAWVSFVLLPTAAVLAADVTPGYTFSSGEQNVTHTKLNNAAAGTINTSFYSGKGSAGADPNTAFELLLRDTSLDVFKRTTIAQALLDHSGLLASRTAKTAPVIGDLVLMADSAAGNAYKQMTWSNWFFSGAASTAPTNETLFPALRGGAAGSMNLSNLLGGLTAHNLPTNGDLFPVLTANGKAVKTISAQDIFASQTLGTNFDGDDLIVSWDGTRLRGNRGSNFIDGVTVTNTTATTNDAFVLLQAGVLKKTYLDTLRHLMRVQNMSQAQYTQTTNLASVQDWTNVVTFGTSSLSNSITPHLSTSKILVRLVLHAAVAGASQPGFVRVTRDGSAIGVGDSDGANRVEAGAAINNGGQLENVVWEWLDSPATTSAVSYVVQVRVTTGGTVYINRTDSDGNTVNNGRLVSTLTLTEVFQ